MEFTLQDLDVAARGNFPYTTDYVAKYINHPKITGRNSLREFLREEGMISRIYPTLFSRADGYMQLETIHYQNGRAYEKIMISPAGLEYIENL